MRDVYPRLFEPAFLPPPRPGLARVPNPRHLSRARYLAIARARRGPRRRAATASRLAPGDVSFPRRRLRAHARAGAHPGASTRCAAPGVRATRRSAIAATRGRRARARRRAAPASPTGRRLQRPARLPPGQADAPRRRAGVRPHGGGGRGRRDRADRHQRLPQRRRAGARCGAANPDPKWVAPPGKSLHRLGTELDLGPPSAYGWLARQRGALRLREALRVGALALRLHAQRGHARRSASARGDGDGARSRTSCRSGSPPAISRAAQRWNVSAALICGAALRRVELQPVRALAGGRAGHRAVHAGHRARRTASANPFDAGRGDRRPGAPDARPAAPLRDRAARARRLQRRARRRSRRAAACRRTPRRARTWRRSSGCSAGRGRRRGGGLEVKLVE